MGLFSCNNDFMERGLGVLISLLIVTGIFVIALMWQRDGVVLQESTSNSNNTSGWVTYRNDDAGFELKYPEELRLRKYAGITKEDGVVLNDDKEHVDLWRGVFKASGFRRDFCYNSEGGDKSVLYFELSDFVQRLTQCGEGIMCPTGSESFDILSKPESFILDGVPAIRFTMKGLFVDCYTADFFPEPVTVIYADYEGKRVQVWLRTGDMTATRILETFEFVR